MNSSVAVSNNCQVLFDQPARSQFEILQNFKDKNLEILKIEKSLNSNGFTTSRTLAEYNSAFKLRPILAKMTSKHRWLDSGAGRALAQLEYLSLFKSSALDSPELIALAYKKPWFVTSNKKKFKYLGGRKLEDYSILELGKFELITDFLGPLSYSKNPAQVLNIYLDMLNVDGTLKIYFWNSYSSVQNRYGELVSLENWIAQNLGKNFGDDIFEVTVEKRTLTVIKKKQQIFKLPDLDLTYFYAELPPIRKYKENNTND